METQKDEVDQPTQLPAFTREEKAHLEIPEPQTEPHAEKLISVTDLNGRTDWSKILSNPELCGIIGFAAAFGAKPCDIQRILQVHLPRRGFNAASIRVQSIEYMLKKILVGETRAEKGNNLLPEINEDIRHRARAFALEGLKTYNPFVFVHSDATMRAILLSIIAKSSNTRETINELDAAVSEITSCKRRDYMMAHWFSREEKKYRRLHPNASEREIELGALSAISEILQKNALGETLTPNEKAEGGRLAADVLASASSKRWARGESWRRDPRSAALVAEILEREHPQRMASEAATYLTGHPVRQDVISQYVIDHGGVDAAVRALRAVCSPETRNAAKREADTAFIAYAFMQSKIRATDRPTKLKQIWNDIKKLQELDSDPLLRQLIQAIRENYLGALGNFSISTQSVSLNIKKVSGVLVPTMGTELVLTVTPPSKKDGKDTASFWNTLLNKLIPALKLAEKGVPSPLLLALMERTQPIRRVVLRRVPDVIYNPKVPMRKPMRITVPEKPRLALLGSKSHQP